MKASNLTIVGTPERDVLTVVSYRYTGDTMISNDAGVCMETSAVRRRMMKSGVIVKEWTELEVVDRDSLMIKRRTKGAGTESWRTPASIGNGSPTEKT